MNEELPKFSGDVLLSKIAKLAKGLTYISETDANIVPFSAGPATTVDARSVTDDQTKLLSVRELSSEDFFQRLTAKQEWHGEKEKHNAECFARLQNLLEENLRDLKVFKVGRIEIDIYVVGLDQNNELIGIKTKAVET